MSDSQVLRPHLLVRTFSRRRSVPLQSSPNDSNDVRSTSLAGTMVEPSHRRKGSLVGLPKLSWKPKIQTTKAVENTGLTKIAGEKQPKMMLLFLPNELLLQVICELTYSLSDILSLRQVSKSMHRCIDANSLTITKALVQDYEFRIPYQCWKSIYPLPKTSGSFCYILEAQQRQHTIVKTCSLLADFIQLEIYRNRSLQFLPKRRRIEQRLQLPILIIHHFLSRLKVKFSDQVCVSDPESNTLPSQAAILAEYPPQLLPIAFQTSKILFSVFRQKLRAPTYAGSLERALRGWNYPPATDLELSQIAIFGGLEEIIHVIAPSKYAARLDLAHDFIADLHRATRGNWKGWERTLEKLPIGAELFIAPTRQKLINDRIIGLHEEIPGSFQWLEGLLNDEIWEDEIAD